MTSHSLEDLLDAVYSKLENQTDGLISADGHLVEDWEIRSARRVKVATDILSLLYRSHQDRHNAASPVNKLIPEILESIFLYLQPNKPFLDKSKHSDWNVHAWIRVTHVCRYWRATALAAKALWRRIVIHYRSRSAAILARAFFERSDPLPIELAHSYSPLQEEEVNSFYSLLNDNPHRIGALSLQGGQLHKKAWSLLQRPLPNLVELALGPRRSVPVTGQRQGNLVFLGGCTDSLRKLRLMGHSWYQVPFRALTHLYLHHDLRGGESRISADDLFRLLRSTSSTLEVLHMHTAPFFGVGHIYSRIQMPSLRYVEVHESVRNRTIFPLLFLQSTVCPRMETIVWDIEYMYTWARHEWNSNMLPPTDYLSGVTSLVVAQVSSHTKCCTLAGATLHIDQIPHVDTLMIAFLGKYLCNVTLLALPDFPLEPYHLMREVLRAYGSVTSLHLGWYEDLVEVLVDLEGHEGLDGESTSAICPNLKSLTIYTGANMKANVHKFREGLRALRLPRLRLSSSQSTRRKRRWRGKTYSTYTLQFCAGDIPVNSSFSRT